MLVDALKCDCRWSGGYRDLVPKLFKGVKGPRLSCPRCRGRRVKFAEPCLESVSSTNPDTARRYRIAHEPRRTVDGDPRLHAFSDGSSNGSYAAVIVRPDSRLTQEHHVRDPLPTPARNVPAEVMGFALALRHLPRGERVVVVSDFLGTALWLQGSWSVGCPHSTPRLIAARSLVESRDLGVAFVHHRGHQRDPSQFSRLNGEADALCKKESRAARRRERRAARRRGA